MTLYEHFWSKGPFTVKLWKAGATTWGYMVTNGNDGGGGSSHRGSQRAALAMALVNTPTGTKYRLVVDDRDLGERIKEKTK